MRRAGGVWAIDGRGVAAPHGPRPKGAPMPVCAETYERVALEDPEGQWELHDGRLVQKPPMTFDHNQIGWELGVRIQVQLGFADWVVRTNTGRVQRSDTS